MKFKIVIIYNAFGLKYFNLQINNNRYVNFIFDYKIQV